MKLYKIVECKDGQYKTLFHGVNGSKSLPLHTWIRAESKLGRDGSGDKWYQTGFHCFKNILDAYLHLYSFKNIEDKCILTCYCEDIWSKPLTYKFKTIYLCKWIYLVENL